jgi:hypothetical protein
MFTLCVFTAVAGGDTYFFYYELRAPKSLKFEGLTRFDVVSENSSESFQLWSITNEFYCRVDGDFVVFTNSAIISSGEKRRGLVVTTDGKPMQVFRLTIPRNPKPIDWTKWQRPDYTETTDAVWTFMHDLKGNDRSTNIPPDSFELRFKIAKDD